jgi:hypothetical protein
MSSKMLSVWLATAGLFLFGITPGNAAEYGAGDTDANAEPKPPLVDWQSVESGDYRTYVSNLQAMGCPKQTIQSLVTADVIGAFVGKRSAAVAARYQNFKYWQANPAETEARAKLTAQQRAIDEEMNGVLQQLLGTEADLPEVSRQWQQEEWNQALAFLTQKKLAATKAILTEYARVNQQMKELAGGLLLTEDTNELQQILARFREEQSTLRQVLLPAEYPQVEMTVSWTAENLRHAMVHFEPTQEEFQAIFSAWQPHDESLAQIYAERQADPGSGEVYAKIKEQLSAARYDQYCTTWWK